MKQKSKFLSILALSLALLSACNSSKAITYTTPEKGISQEELTKQVDMEPSKIENQDDAEMYVYNECNYYDYTGEMTYYFAQDMLSLSRWESIAESEQAGKDMYQNILNKIKEENGEGTLSEDGNSCVWDTDKKTITLGYVHDEEGYKVYVLESGK